MTRDVHRYVTVFYQQIENGNIANQIHEFTIEYGKFILIKNGQQMYERTILEDSSYAPAYSEQMNIRRVIQLGLKLL